MARLIPLYSNSSLAEIDQRAQKLFDQMRPNSGGYPKCWEQAEVDYLEHLRVTPPPPSMICIQAPIEHFSQSHPK